MLSLTGGKYQTDWAHVSNNVLKWALAIMFLFQLLNSFLSHKALLPLNPIFFATLCFSNPIYFSYSFFLPLHLYFPILSFTNRLYLFPKHQFLQYLYLYEDKLSAFIVFFPLAHSLPFIYVCKMYKNTYICKYFVCQSFPIVISHV